MPNWSITSFCKEFHFSLTFNIPHYMRMLTCLILALILGLCTTLYCCNFLYWNMSLLHAYYFISFRHNPRPVMHDVHVEHCWRFYHHIVTFSLHYICFPLSVVDQISVYKWMPGWGGKSLDPPMHVHKCWIYHFIYLIIHLHQPISSTTFGNQQYNTRMHI